MYLAEINGQQFPDADLEESVKDMTKRPGKFIVADKESDADFLLVGPAPVTAALIAHCQRRASALSLSGAASRSRRASASIALISAMDIRGTARLSRTDWGVLARVAWTSESVAIWRCNCWSSSPNGFSDESRIALAVLIWLIWDHRVKPARSRLSAA